MEFINVLYCVGNIINWRVQLVVSFPVNSLRSTNWLYLAQLTPINIKANTWTVSNINTAKL